MRRKEIRTSDRQNRQRKTFASAEQLPPVSSYHLLTYFKFRESFEDNIYFIPKL